MKYKKGQKVQWIDPVTREKRTGILIERTEVVAVMGLNDNKLRNVNYYSWDVAEWGTGEPFAIPEEDLIIKKKTEYEN